MLGVVGRCRWGRHRWARAAVLGLFLALAAAACGVTTTVRVTVAPNGSGTVSVEVLLDHQAAEAVGDPSSAFDTKGLPAGWQAGHPTSVSGGGEEITVTHPFAEVAQIQGILAGLAITPPGPASNPTGTTGTSKATTGKATATTGKAAATTGKSTATTAKSTTATTSSSSPPTTAYVGRQPVFDLWFSRRVAAGVTTYRAAGWVDLRCGLDCFGDAGLQQAYGSWIGVNPSSSAGDGGAAAVSVRFVVVLSLPGAVRSADGATRNGDELTWAAPLGHRTAVAAETAAVPPRHVAVAPAASEHAWSVPTGLVVVGGATAAVVVGLLLVLAARRRRGGPLGAHSRRGG